MNSVFLSWKTVEFPEVYYLTEIPWRIMAFSKIFANFEKSNILIMNIKNIMGTSVIASVLITIGCVLLVLGSLPIENKIEGNNLIVKYVIGRKVIDISDAVVMPVPEEVNHNIIRVGGTSVGKKHSGNYMNTKTRTKYKFYLTGKGERTYFEIGSEKYLVDGVSLK